MHAAFYAGQAGRNGATAIGQIIAVGESRRVVVTRGGDDPGALGQARADFAGAPAPCLRKARTRWQLPADFRASVSTTRGGWRIALVGRSGSRQEPMTGT